MRKEKKNRKAKRKEKKRRRKRKQRERKRIRREKERKRERENFPAFGRSKFDSSRTKVGARSDFYVWTLKSWSFDKLCEVGVLSYLSYTLFKCFVDD